MERKGICTVARGERYTIGMATELVWRFSGINKGKSNDENTRSDEFGSLKEALLADPDLLKNDVWSLFEHEGDSRGSLAGLEVGREVKDSWRVTLVELAREGHICGNRLLDECLAAIGREFRPHYASWFIGLHNDLAPTATELAPRQHRYVQFLGSANPATVKLAVEALARLQKATALDYGMLVNSMEPVFRVKSKGTILQALKLLTAAVASNPTLADNAVERALNGLIHEAAPVQEAILKFAEGHASKPRNLGELLAPYAAAIAPSVQPLFNRLSAKRESPKVEIESSPVPLPVQLGDVTPIATLDELIDRAAYYLENPEDVIELERVLDGLLRLSQQRRDDMEVYASALLKKCNQVAPLETRGLAWSNPLALFVILLRNWITDGNDFPDRVPTDPSYQSFFIQRLRGLREPLAKKCPLPLLAAPMKVNGNIQPAALVERASIWLKSGFQVPVAEVVAAILRLSREGRREALPQARTLPGEIGAAIAYAMGEEGVEIGPTAALWIAASRQRFSGQNDPIVARVHSEYGPDATEPAEHIWDVQPTGRKYPPLECLVISHSPVPTQSLTSDHFAPMISQATDARGLGKNDGFFFFYLEDMMVWRWATTVWPDGTEAFLANGAHLLANYSATSAKEYFGTVRYLFDLFQSPQPRQGPMAELFLALGCISRKGEIRSLAVDTLVHLVNTRQLPSWNLGAPIARLSHSATLFVGGRLQIVLKELSRVSTAHQKAAWNLLHSIFEAQPNPGAKDGGKLLELFVELSIATTLHPSLAANAFLAKLPATPKLKKLRAQLTAQDSR
jgi:hypothetical protein